MSNMTALRKALSDPKKKLGEAGSIIIANLGCMMAYNFWKKCFPIVALDDWQTKMSQSNYTQILGRSSRGGPLKPKTFGLYSEVETDQEVIVESLSAHEEYPNIQLPPQ